MTTKTINRRTAIAISAAAIAAPGLLHAQDSRPIEWVLGYAAGGGSDAVARTVGEAMSKALGQPIVINNKPGAATNIAAAYVANSKDYGHVLLTADFATLAVNPWIFPKLQYNAEKDFVPVGMLARFPMLLVVAPNVPAKNFKEFLAWVKASPTAVSYASAGVGSPHHLAAELLAEKTGLKFQHVAYRGGAPAVLDLLGGNVPFALMDTASVVQYIANGKLKALGVASPQRLQNMPEIPTLIEQGLADYTAYAWQGLVVPTGTPPETVTRLSNALQSSLNSAFVKERFQTLALETMPGSAQQMTDYVKIERERWGKLIVANGIKAE